jgi:hypothetical protein
LKRDRKSSSHIACFTRIHRLKAIIRAANTSPKPVRANLNRRYQSFQPTLKVCLTYRITNMRSKCVVNQHDTCQRDNIIELALLLLYTASWQL